MKKGFFYSGLFSVAAGLICFAVHILARPAGNKLLLIGLFLVLAGTAGHVWLMKGAIGIDVSNNIVL